MSRSVATLNVTASPMMTFIPTESASRVCQAMSTVDEKYDMYTTTSSYQYDVDPTTQSFDNHRVFAYSDNGVPDGIQLDTNGNVYSGTHVWNSQGTSIGKFFIHSTSLHAVMFTKSGFLILSEQNIYLANINAQGVDLAAY